MGQCISEYMERANTNELVDFEPYINYSSYGPQMSIVPNTSGDKVYSPIYRMANVSENHFKRLQNFESGEGTCIKVVEKFCEERQDLPCLAYRVLKQIDKTVITNAKGEQKTMDVYIFEEGHHTITYTQFWDNIIACGRGLRSIGLNSNDKLVMFEETRWEWLTTMYSCWSQELVVCTVYANLGEEALIAAFKEVHCAAIVCNGSNVVKVIEYLQKSKLDKVKIIYLDNLPADVNSQEFELYAWTSIVESGKSDAKNIPYYIPDVEEVNNVALIMYTSGTTGDPKGVVHTHGSLRAGVRSLDERVMEYLGPPKDEEWYCSYLPLAHIMEFGVTSIFMIRGVVIGYGTPRTLTDQFARPHGDLVEYKPVFIVAVPRVLESMKRAVESKLPRPGTLKRRIFDNAYKARLRALQNGKDTPYYNKKVFALPRKVIGGRLYGMLSGGGPLSAATQEFVNVVFGMVVQGYGLTETVCCGSIQRTGNLDYDNVGQLLSCVELKLRNTGEFRYTDKPMPRGEICLRGACLMREYFKQAELTKEALDEDGWFHTGDVGAIAPNFTLRIIGRVKSLAKNSNGEYLALEKLESVYGTNPVVVPGGVCVLVNPARSYIALIGVTTNELVEKFKVANELSGSYPEILGSKKFQAAVLKSFQETGREAKRRPFEIVKAVRLISDEWSSANGLLTVAMKLKRSAVETKYKELIDELFEND